MTGGGKHFILDYASFSLAHACLDLVLDVVILAMPLFMIKDLKLSTKKKVALMGIFLLGSLYVKSTSLISELAEY